MKAILWHKHSTCVCTTTDVIQFREKASAECIVNLKTCISIAERKKDEEKVRSTHW